MGDDSYIDPSKTRHKHTAAAKERAPFMSDERREELRKKYGTETKPAKKRRSSEPVYGTMDGVSVPVYANFRAEPFMHGESNDFLFPLGAGQSSDDSGVLLPRQLRQGGWVFLRADHELVARVKFLGVEHRTSRIEHVPSEGGVFEDRGPGRVLAVDPGTWEDRSDPLTSPSESGNGYRYYMMDGDRPVWTPVG